MIHLTTPDGTGVSVALFNIREVRPFGTGALIFFDLGVPLRVRQSVGIIAARWRRPLNRWVKGEQ